MNDQLHWIDVNERLPEAGQRVLIIRKKGFAEIATYCPGHMEDGELCEWQSDWYNFYVATHWMPIPYHPSL